MCLCFCLCSEHVTNPVCVCVCRGVGRGESSVGWGGEVAGVGGVGESFSWPLSPLWTLFSSCDWLTPRHCHWDQTERTHTYLWERERRRRRSRRREEERGKKKRRLGSQTDWHKYKKTEREKVSRKDKAGLNESDAECQRVNVSISVTFNAARQPVLETSPETASRSVKGGVCPLLMMISNYTCNTCTHLCSLMSSREGLFSRVK